MDVPMRAPSLLDPRVFSLVPPAQRAAMTSLWQLDSRLAAIVRTDGDMAIRQIKLAWWRESLADLDASKARGEPLLASLAVSGFAANDLIALVDAWEIALFADNTDEWQLHAAARGPLLYCLTDPRAAGHGAGWALADSAISLTTNNHALLWELAETRLAENRLPRGTSRALVSLDRWAQMVARHKGARHPGREALLLLRIGIFGR